MAFNYCVPFVCDKESMRPFLKKYDMNDEPFIIVDCLTHIERFESPIFNDFKNGYHSIIIHKQPRGYVGNLIVMGIDEKSCENILDDFWKMTKACKCGRVSTEVL